MKHTCAECGESYDDARQWITCPHPPLMDDVDIARKEAAIALLGKTVRFAHQPTGPNRDVITISRYGMVMLSGDDIAGEFSPNSLVVVEKT